MSRRSVGGRILASSFLLAANLTMSSCASDGGPSEPGSTTGAIEVTTSTSGIDGPTAYVVVVDGAAPRAVAATGTTLLSGIAAGPHTVELAEVPSNCSVSGTNPRSVTVVVDRAHVLIFDVACTELTGQLVVSAVSTGEEIDPEGYTVDVPGEFDLPIGVDGTIARTLGIGDFQVQLVDVAENCMVTGANPRNVTIEADAQTSTTFEVACEAYTGAIEVVTETVGADPDDEYTIALDDLANSTVGATDTMVLNGVPKGAHVLTLGGIAANCSTTAENPLATPVTAGDTSRVEFPVSCVPLVGDLRITANTTGTPVDPDGYLVSVDSGPATALGVNGDTVTLADVSAGSRSVRLDGIASGCIATSPNPLTVVVPFGEEVSATFDVECTEVPGAIRLRTSSSGYDGDPDGYTVSLDGSSPAMIGPNERRLFEDLAAGAHVFELADVAANCAVQGDNPRTVEAVGGDTVDVTMDVVCEEIPNESPIVTISAPDTTRSLPPLSVAPGMPVTFTGAAADPEDGSLGGGSLAWTSNIDGELGSGEMITTSSLSTGLHTVTLSALDSEGGVGSATVLVIVTEAPAPGFQITLRLAEGVTLTPTQRTAIEQAVARLESIITGDVMDVTIELPGFSCSAQIPPTDETVDDLLVYLAIEPIDGPGGILGAAGPCGIRGGSGIPYIGGMRFDADDLATIVEPQGLLDELLLHETMHTMGFGTVWDLLGYLEDPSVGNPGADTYFDGPAAIARFLQSGGDDYAAGNIVPVENDTDVYGPGSLDGHWRESVFVSEIMSPSVNFGTNPLSAVTIGQFEDLGYAVDYAAADPFSPALALRALVAGPTLRLGGDLFRGPLWVARTGGGAVRIR